MADLGAVIGGSKKPYHLFTSLPEARSYADSLGSLGRTEYGVKSLMVYGVYSKKSKRRVK